MVVTQLTRMDAPRICIAGIDPETSRHVRPITGRERPLTRELLSVEDGLFALGNLLDVGPATPDPKPPETEDHIFDPEAARILGQLTQARYLQLLRDHARDRVEGIFGDELVRRGRSYAIDRDCGAVSLGVLRPRRRPDLYVDDYGKLRLRLNGTGGCGRPPSLSVTDVRFVEADHATIREDMVADVKARMRRGVGALLLLGVARPFTAQGDDRERH